MWPVYVPPPPPEPDPGESQSVDRHLGMRCGCFLLGCCHNEDQPPCPSSPHPHHHSGSPATGYVYPWEPGDESWRDRDDISMIIGAGGRNVTLAY
jgi:hypothetical protein